LLLHKKYKTHILKKWLCFLVLFCFGLRTVSYAVQPFANNKIDSISDAIEATSQDNVSLLHILGGLLNMDLNGDGHELFSFKMDKQTPRTHQFRLKEYPKKNSFEYNYKIITATALQCLTACNRTFSVPAHYHFLFRLTPF
jgi:hypothetical protein